MWSSKSKFTVLRLKKGFIFVDSPLTLSYYILGPSAKNVSKVNERKKYVFIYFKIWLKIDLLIRVNL